MCTNDTEISYIHEKVCMLGRVKMLHENVSESKKKDS